MEAAGDWLEKLMDLGSTPDSDLLSSVVAAAQAAGAKGFAHLWMQRAAQVGVELEKGLSGKRRSLSRAEGWLEAAAEEGHPLDKFFCNVLLQAAAYDDDQDGVERWLRQAVKGRFPLTPGTLLGFMKAASYKGDLSGTEAWLKRAQKLGIEPDEAMMFSLMTAAVKRGKIFKAREVLNTLLEMGCSSAKCYAPLINCYASTGDVKNAFRLFQDMESTGVEPNPILYSMLIKCCAETKPKERQLAERVFFRMVNDGITPNLPPQLSLRKAVGQERLLELCTMAGIECLVEDRRTAPPAPMKEEVALEA